MKGAEESPSKRSSFLTGMASLSRRTPSSPGESSSPAAESALTAWASTGTLDVSANEAEPSPPPPPAVSQLPKAGFTTAGHGGLQLLNGDGTAFSLRVGPDYKKHGKKAASAAHVYAPLTIDVFKRKQIAFHVASKLALPPPPDGAGGANDSGLPRRLVVNCILPADAPPMFGAGTDGSCYQIVVVFGATAEALAQWKAGGSAASRLFMRFVTGAPEGVLPASGDLDIKERLKLLPWLDNMDTLGLPGWIAGYNGKPALITKSGAMFRGDDYLEISMNTFRFGARARGLRVRVRVRRPEERVTRMCVRRPTGRDVAVASRRRDRREAHHARRPSRDADARRPSRESHARRPSSRRRAPRAGFLTKKGVHFLHPRLGEFDFHVALTVEGRDDDELPEQVLCAARIRGLDVRKLASAVDIEAPPQPS